MPIIRTLKESGHSYEAAKQKLLEATAHFQEDEGIAASSLQVHKAPKRNRIISDSSSSSSSSSESRHDDDDDGDDDGDDDDDEEDVISQNRQRKREKKLLRNLEKEMKRKRNIISISRPSSYKRTDMHSIAPKPKSRKPKAALLRIAALNESSEEPDSDEESEVELTKEAQEEEAFSLYKKALEFQRSGNEEKAQETYNELLHTRFLSKVKASQDERRGGVTNTAITLKYSSYKNLGNLALAREDTDNAMENYLEAVNLDSTDVTLWYRIGTVAVKLSQLALARVAFEQGLKCSKFHWPCLDYLCTVLYAINDYVTCLYYIAQALERDKRYTKGFALRDQIYSEQPCLRRDCLDLFKHCDDEVLYFEVPKDKQQKIVDEALSLRHKRQELAKAPPLPRIKFLQPLNEFRWKALGERLVALYDHMTSKDPPMSLITVVDLEEYKLTEPGAKGIPSEEAKKGPSPTPMEVDPSNQRKASTSPVPGGSEGETEGQQIPTDTPGHIGGQTPGEMGGQTLGQMDGLTPGQMGGHSQMTEEPKQADAEVPMEVDADEQSRVTPEENAMVSDQMGSLGGSAMTLKQLAETYLKNLGSHLEGALLPQETSSTSAVQMEKEQDPPDSTTAGLDSAPVPSDLPNMELLADSAAGSSQDSIQQAGRESNLESTQDKDAIARQQTKGHVQHEDAVSMDTEESQAEKSRRGPKRKRMLRDMPAPGKRRSARVRNTTVKKKEEEEIVNYTEVLRQFLPSTLLVSDEEEEELQFKKTGEKELKQPDIKKTTESQVKERDAFAATETEDVHSLLMECQLNNGIIDVMTRYLERLVAKHDLKWPDGLAAVFLEVYKRLRKHISLPELLCCDEDEMVLREMSMMCLLSAEFNLDQCLSAKTNGSTPAASPAMLGANTTACSHKWGEHHEDDMMYLQELTLMQYMLPDLWPVVPARVYWLKARYYLQIGKTAEGEEAYERCKEVLKREEEQRKEERRRAKEGKVEKEEEKMETEEAAEADEPRPVEVVVANIKHGALISIASISSEVESLQRCQSLEQLQRLHASGDHTKVVELLRPSLRHTPRAVRPENTPERCSQLLLLIQSQMELKDTKESVLCCVLGMVETWQGVLRDGLQAYHQLWLETLNKTLVHLQKAFESCEISALGAGGTGLLRKAVNVLIKIIEWTMDQADVNSTTNATSIMPWVVLYHIIKYEEDHLAAKSLPSSDHESGEGSRSPTSVPMLPSSLMLLENAHDYLGRQSWCCNCEGALLKLYIRVLSTELGKYTDEDRHPFNSDLRHTLEQCFFCLYGHPTKKAKTRHLQDHNAAEVQLDWSNCCYIFDYFKPKTFPEFDSYKASSMSGELEGLLLKISKVIPQDAKPENALEQVQGYVDGSIEKAPALPEGFTISSTVVQELYYLLADYYFKNKDFGKAIKFYLHDICVSPDRLDSWAGMALARVGRLDLKLNNSTDTKSDGPIFKHGMAALRCFKRALEIDATNYSLWIEYGSYAYILHSHASRQIKQKDQLKISDEDVETLSVKQAEMLEEAEHCFKQASLCEGEGDEEWLVHYMLGKVAEKRLLMEESLRHYLQASHHLHENEARYPKKIPYHNPTNFSLEALEMYFRIHSAILKLVQCSLPGAKVKLEAYGTLEGLVQEATQLPFVRAEEKKREPSSEPSTDTEQEGRIRPSKPDTPPSLAPKRRGSPLYVATPQDHDYLHEKYRRSRSRVSSQEEVTDTASESDIFSGDESMSSFLSVQRSTITLRPVPARRALSAAEAQAVQPTPDGTPLITGLGDETTPKDEAPQKLDYVSHEKDQPEGRTATEDITATAPCQDTKEEIPAIVVSKPSPESEATPKMEGGLEKGDVPTTCGEDKEKLIEKPDTTRAETDVSTVATASGDAEPAEAMDTEEQKEPEHVFATPASAPTIGEDNSQDGERKIDAKSPVAMDTDDAVAARKTDAGESRDSGGSNRECPGEIKEEVEEGNVEGSALTLEEKMEVGPSGDVKEEKQDGGENMENDTQTIKITKEEEGGKGTIEEVGNTKHREQKPSNDEIEAERKEDEVGDDAETPLPREKDDAQDDAGAKDGIKMEEKTPDAGVGGKGNGQRESQGTIGIVKEEEGGKREEPCGNGKEPVVFQKKISADSSQEILPSEIQTHASIPQVDMVQGKETEDLSVAPDIKEEAKPKVEGMAVEADSTKGEITNVQSQVDDLPQVHDAERGESDEKQDQGEKIGDHEVDGQGQGHQAGSDDLPKDSADRAQDELSTEEVQRQDKGPDSRPVGSVDEDIAEGEGKDKENEAVKKERKVEEDSKMQGKTEEMMDTGGQGKGDADQNKEGNSTKTPIITEGSEASSTVDATRTEDDKPRDDALSTKEKEKASGETEMEAIGKTEGQTEQKTEGKKEGETEVEVDEETKKRHLRLIDACLGALRLCLQRFPQHYKAAYRMAYLYAYAPTHKNLVWSKDILIGSGSGQPPKTPADHVVAPALFSEQYKSKNLFQGIWRNPIQDIDRSGSFPWHMYRSVALLIYILQELKDHVLLLQVTTKLYRIPEQDKKYLRDADRHFLAREAFDAYRSTIRSQLASPSITGEERQALLMSSFRCYQYTQMKQPTLSSLASELLTAAYATLKGNTVESEPGLLEQATRFCDHHITFHKVPRTPTHGDGMPHRSYIKDTPSGFSSRPGLPSEGRRLGRSSSSSSDQGGVAEPIGQDGKAVGRGAGMEVAVSEPGVTKMPAEDSMQAPSARTLVDSNLSVDSRMQESLKAEDQGKDSETSQSEKAKLVSQLSRPEQDSFRRAESSGLGMLEGGMKRKFSQVESTSENIASIIQEAARQIERTEAHQRERLGMNSSAIPQAKRFAGGITEPSSSKAFFESAPRVHIGALGSVSTTPRNLPQQRPTSLTGTSKQAMSLGYPANVSKSGIVKKRVGPLPHSVSRDPGQRSEASSSKPTTVKSPLSPPYSGYADSFQKFLKQQQQQLSSVVKTYDIYDPESTTGRNPAPAVSKVTSGSLLGQVGLGSVTPNLPQTSSTSAAAVPPKLPGTAARPKLPVSSAVRPKVPGTAAARSKLPRADAAQPKHPGASALRPKLPGAAAVRPRIPGSSAVRPKVPGSATMRPKLPGSSAVCPKVPDTATMRPKLPGSSVVRPKVPGTATMRPKLPGSSAVCPKLPGAAAVRSKHPSAMAYEPKVPGTSTQISASQGSSQQMPLQSRAGMSQVAKITSSTPATPRQGVRQVSGVGGHRESLPATRETPTLGQAHPLRESPGNVGLPVLSQEAPRRVVQAGRSQATERPQGTGEDLLTIIDSTEKSKT